MKPLKNILEGVLSDIDTTIDSTDSFLQAASDEFEVFKKHMLDIKNYDHFKSRTGFSSYTTDLYVANLCGFLGLNDRINTIRIQFIKHTKLDKNRTTYYVVKMLSYEKYNDVYNTQFIGPAIPISGSRPKSIINNDLKPVFKDLNTFAKFVRKNVEDNEKS